jgi:hypothetical protein
MGRSKPESITYVWIMFTHITYFPGYLAFLLELLEKGRRQARYFLEFDTCINTGCAICRAFSVYQHPKA